MAKADDTSSTIDIWLRDALVLAAKALGSEALAKERLTKWLAAGKVPWSGVSWKGSKGRKNALRSAKYRSGDRRFWRCHLEIDWQDNAAYEAHRDGAQALGIKVSRAHLLTLLPAAPGEHEETRGRPSPQMRRVLQVLKKLYPPHGNVPDDVSTEVVRARVNEELAVDSKNRELAAPSWDTVNRALGRG